MTAAEPQWVWEYALQYDQEFDPTMDHPSSWRTVQRPMAREMALAALSSPVPRRLRNKTVVRRRVTEWEATS